MITIITGTNIKKCEDFTKGKFRKEALKFSKSDMQTSSLMIVKVKDVDYLLDSLDTKEVKYILISLGKIKTNHKPSIIHL